jgi:hypothetical protein
VSSFAFIIHPVGFCLCVCTQEPKLPSVDQHMTVRNWKLTLSRWVACRLRVSCEVLIHRVVFARLRRPGVWFFNEILCECVIHRPCSVDGKTNDYRRLTRGVIVALYVDATCTGIIQLTADTVEGLTVRSTQCTLTLWYSIIFPFVTGRHGLLCWALFVRAVRWPGRLTTVSGVNHSTFYSKDDNRLLG